MFRKMLFFIILINVVFTSLAFATTYYMSNSPGPGGEWVSGSNSNDGLSKFHPFLTMRYATSKMHSGDTLVIADGIYQGSNNMIDAYGDYGGCPPEGSPSAYTVVKAEHDGKVILDGEGMRRPILIRGNDSVDGHTGSSSSHDYIELKGLVAKNSNEGCILIYYCNHIKVINCGAVDAADGNHMAIEIGRSTFCLLEGCYAWGNGRYKISVGGAHYCIIRNCVVRHDRASPQGDPMGGIINYGNYHNEVENCIVIDSDKDNYFINYAQDQGAFGNPGTSARSNSGPVNFHNCIALNNHLRFGTSDWGQYHNDIYYTDCVGWDLQTLDDASFYGSSGDVHFNQCTFGEVRTEDGSLPEDRGNFWGYNEGGLGGNYNSTINTIIYDFIEGGLFQQWEESVYNNIYGLSPGRPVDLAGSSTSNTISLNPINNGLLYITRIESGSSLQTAGISGGRIGANIMKMYGKPGTLWGEDGYDKLQDGTNGQADINLWPFPNEDIIREHMRTYSYDNGNLSGARGFCADSQTLTRYIWEYIGNPIPPEIYGSSGATARAINCAISGTIQ